MSKTRNYGIDLLRLVLMFMVCMLHILSHGGVLSSCGPGAANYALFWLLETISYCAVDGFAIISGYTASGKPVAFSKIISMWFQVHFYSLVLTLFLSFAGVPNTLGLSGILKTAFPVTFGIYWYFNAYIALAFFMPFLNAYLFSIDERTAKKAFLILIGLFSVLGIVADSFATAWGYSPIWLMVLYCLGLLAKRINLFAQKRSATLVLLFAVCVLGTWGVLMRTGLLRLIHYISPTTLMCGILLVILFSRIPVKGRVISKLSPLAFGIYLFQLNPLVWDGILTNACSFIAQKSLIVGTLWAFACAALLFAAGMAVEFLRSSLAKMVKLHVLSQKIADLCERLVEKAFVLLK